MEETTIAKSELSTKEQILNVTIDLIKTGRIGDITVRKVAAMAGANIGAINYHFGTKEKLIEEAFGKILSPIRDIYLILDSTEGTAKERLKKFLLALINHFHELPDPLKYQAIIKNFISGDISGMVSIFRKSTVDKLIKNLGEVTQEKDMKKLTIIAMQIIASIVLPNIIIATNKVILGSEVPGPEKQTEILLERII